MKTIFNTFEASRMSGVHSRVEDLRGTLRLHWLDTQGPGAGLPPREQRQGLHAGEYEPSILRATAQKGQSRIDGAVKHLLHQIRNRP